MQLYQIMRFTVLIFIGVILVKSGYSKEEIGGYELFFFLANIISFFWAMGLKNALISYYPSLDEDHQKSFFFNIGIIFIGLSLLAGSILYLMEDYFAYWINGTGNLKHIDKIIYYLILIGPAGLVEYFYLLKDRSVWIIKYGLIIFLLQLVLISGGIILKLDISALLWLMVWWAGFRFLWFVLLIIRDGGLVLDLYLIRSVMVFSAPLILHMLLGNGMEYVDGFLVNYFFDEGTFAQFRYGARELPITTLLVGALSTAIIPSAVRDLASSMEEVKIKIRRLMNFLFPVSLVFMLISPIVFPLIYSEEFAISARLFNIYLLILSSRIWMPQIVLFAKHDNGILVFSAFIELIVNIILSLILLRYYGILGIAWATVIAFLVNKLLLAFFAWKRHGVGVGAYLNLKGYFIWLLILSIGYYITTYYH